MTATGHTAPSATSAVLFLMIGFVSACDHDSATELQLSRVQPVPVSPSVVVEQNHMRFGVDSSQIGLDFLVMAVDTFHWIDASESPFGWRILESGQGQLITRFDGENGALLDVSAVADAVHLESDMTVDVEDTWYVSLVLRGRSLDDRDGGNDNTQEFFFKTGPSGQFTEFVMFDMGGSSPNPTNPDRACGGNRQTPFNRDQLSTRSRIQDTQCWDGFSNAPVDWRVGSTKSLEVSFADGTANAYVDDRLVAHLDEEMGQTLRDLRNPIIWIKNVDKGGGEDLLIESITLYDLNSRETAGDVTMSVPIDANGEAILVRPMGVFPPSSTVIVELSESFEGPFRAEDDPIRLAREASELFVKLRVVSPDDPSGFSLEGLQIEYYR